MDRVFNTDKIIDMMCEYRSIVRELSIKAIKENWSEHRLNSEIEKVSRDVDKFLDTIKYLKSKI